MLQKNLSSSALSPDFFHAFLISLVYNSVTLRAIKKPLRQDLYNLSKFIFNSLHATGLYIDHMNNSIAKKEIMKRKKKRGRKLPNRGKNSKPMYENHSRYPTRHASTYNVLRLYGPYKPIASSPGLSLRARAIITSDDL